MESKYPNGRFRPRQLVLKLAQTAVSTVPTIHRHIWSLPRGLLSRITSQNLPMTAEATARIGIAAGCAREDLLRKRAASLPSSEGSCGFERRTAIVAPRSPRRALLVVSRRQRRGVRGPLRRAPAGAPPRPSSGRSRRCRRRRGASDRS